MEMTSVKAQKKSRKKRKQKTSLGSKEKKINTVKKEYTKERQGIWRVNEREREGGEGGESGVIDEWREEVRERCKNGGK